MKKGGHQIFGSYRRDFFLARFTQRPVLQEKGPPQGRGSYENNNKNEPKRNFNERRNPEGALVLFVRHVRMANGDGCRVLK